MNLEYRNLGIKDIPALKKLSQAMKTTPSLIKLAKKCLEEPECSLYGCFESKKLLGIGNLRRKSKNLVWIDAILIHPNASKQELSKSLFKFGEDLAKTQGYKYIGFTIGSTNQDTIATVEELDFKVEEKIESLSTTPSEYTFEGKSFLGQKKLPLKDALTAIRNLTTTPKEEIYINANYFPTDYEILSKIKEISFYEHKGTILIETYELDKKKKRKKEIRSFLYGSKEGVVELLNGFLRRNITVDKPVFCICHENLIPLAKEVGFSKTEEPISFLLFKKKIV